MEASRQRRAAFVDALRLVAIFQMVQGHSVDAVLALSLRAGWLHDAWRSARGLTSGAFLFAAGMSFYMVAVLPPVEARASGRPRRVRRAVLLVALGYALHVTPGLATGDGAAFRELAAVDILQCIGVCLLVAEMLVAWIGRAAVLAVVAALLAAVALCVGERGLALAPSGGERWLLGYFTRGAGSIFPLLPFAGYFFGGLALGAVALAAGGAPRSAGRAVRVLGVSGVLSAAAGLVLGVPWVKLGLVVLVAAGLAALENRLARLPGWLMRLSRQSLVIYVSHILVLYGAGVGIVHMVGRRLPLFGALGVAAAMLLFSLAVGLVADRLSAASRRQLARGAPAR